MANESMIAACPKCTARYRLERARLRSEGVRLRCTRCEAVFRVTPPAGAAAPPEPSSAQPSAEASNPEPSLPVQRELPPVAARAVAPPAEVASPSPQVVAPPAEVASPPSQAVASPAEVESPLPQAVSPPAEAPAPLASESAIPAPESGGTAQALAGPELAAMPSAMPVSDPAAQVPETRRQADPPAALAQPRPDPAGEPADEAERRTLVLLADSDVDAGKGLASTLASWGLEPLLVHDGVEAILTIQRALPRLVILDAALPKMFGFQVCELMKRNESLRSIPVVLLGAIHHRDRYRRAPSEIYGADAYAERPELPEALRPILSRFGLPARASAEMPESPPAAAAPPVAPDVAPMLEPLLEVDPAPEPLLEAEPAPEPLLAVGTAAEPLLEVDPAAEPLLEVDPAAEPLLEVEPALEVAAPGGVSSDPALPGLAAASSSPASEVLAEPVLESLDPGPDQDFEVLDVDDESFDDHMPIEPVTGDLLAEPSVAAPASLAEPEPLLAQPPPAADVSQLEPPTAELPVQVEAAEPADPAVSAAERLARIIVSDVVLYNPEKFEEGVRIGNVVELLDAELEEGRGLFEQRVAPELRTGRDFLADELVRVARSRGMQA